ncbi:MAG: c-type cytochrome [Betaproteobacteria bacterium]|nr:c-type cytochrome [Betaproteobacteria bacterium]
MRSITIAVAAAFAIVVSGTVGASEDLAKSSGCMACHAMDAKKMGPSFKDVSAKYKGKSDAASVLAAKLNEAKGHLKVKAGAGDVGTLVKWMLSL